MGFIHLLEMMGTINRNIKVGCYESLFDTVISVLIIELDSAIFGGTIISIEQSVILIFYQ